jgi:transcriptional regulator with XRE-family HTH domain
MYQLHSPEGWDVWGRTMAISVEFARKDATFVSDARNPTVRRRELGALLRALRNEKGLTVEQVAERLLCSPSKVSRMETGHGVATLRDVRDLCELYEVTDEAERDRMTRLAREGKQQGWWQAYDLPYSTYVGLEEEAASIKIYDSAVVPGLLQIAEYAWAVHAGGLPRQDDNVIGQWIEARATRQRILTRPNPPSLHVVLDEAVLHRVVGSPEIMRAQLNRVVEAMALPNVKIQIIPYASGAHPALDSVFTLLEFSRPASDVIYVEGLVGHIYLEQARDVRRYSDVFDRLSVMALSQRKSRELLRKVITKHKD